jgi:hypothetical protein
MDVSGQLYVLTTLPLGKEPPEPIRLGWSKSSSGCSKETETFAHGGNWICSPRSCDCSAEKCYGVFFGLDRRVQLMNIMVSLLYLTGQFTWEMLWCLFGLDRTVQLMNVMVSVLDWTGLFSDWHVLMHFSQLHRSKEYFIQICKHFLIIVSYYN